MPSRITFADVKASRIPNVLNLPATDSRVAYYVNEAVQRLLPMGHWVGTVQKYRFCAINGYVTLPRWIEQVLGVAICNRPINIRSEWFEFAGLGRGIRQETDGFDRNWLDSGTACSFADIAASGHKVKVYCDFAEDATAAILLQGVDTSGNRIQVSDGAGGYTDGEYVAAAVAGTLSNSTFGLNGLVSVQKPITKGPIRLYDYDPGTATQTVMAIYAPNETRPIYRRGLIPGLSNVGACASTVTNPQFTCADKTVTVLAKMAFVPVARDTDWLLIGNLPALKMACMAVKKEEANKWDEAAVYLNGGELKNGVRIIGAKQILEDELKNWIGDATLLTLNMPPAALYGGGVANVL